jgi:hypothetical protein
LLTELGAGLKLTLVRTLAHNWPKPLYTKGYAIRTLVEIIDRATNHGSGKELANNPTHIDESSEIGSQYDWGYF